MKKGFTLIEFLFIIIILSVLLAFGLGMSKYSTDVANTNSVRHDIKNIIAKQQDYFAKYGEYFCCHGYETDIEKGLLNCSYFSEDGNNVFIPVSKGNSVWTCAVDCGDGTISLYTNVSPLNMPYYDEDKNDLEYDGCSQGVITKFGTSSNNPF